MKRRLLLTTSALFLLSACASAPKAVNVTGCLFPETGVEAPGWTCDEPQPGVEFSAVGVAEPSLGSQKFRMAVAKGRALAALARYIGPVRVRFISSVDDETVVEQRAMTGSGNDETVKQALVGSKVLKSLTGPNGHLFVLVGWDGEITQNAGNRIPAGFYSEASYFNSRGSIRDDRIATAVWTVDFFHGEITQNGENQIFNGSLSNRALRQKFFAQSKAVMGAK